MTVRVVNESHSRVPFNIEKLVRRLLSQVPQEHLIGLDAIIVCDTVRTKGGRQPLAIYQHKQGREPATIAIALREISRRWGAGIFFVPAIGKFTFASVIYHEIGHHYQQFTHGGPGAEQFAEEYSKRMVQKAFYRRLHLLAPLARPLRWLSGVLERRAVERRKSQ